MSPELKAMIIGAVLGLLVGLALRKLADKLTIEHLTWRLTRAGEQIACMQRRLEQSERDYAELLDVPPFGRAMARSLAHMPIARDALAQIDANSRN